MIILELSFLLQFQQEDLLLQMSEDEAQNFYLFRWPATQRQKKVNSAKLFVVAR